jgi:hypothetical protein
MRFTSHSPFNRLLEALAVLQQRKPSLSKPRPCGIDGQALKLGDLLAAVAFDLEKDEHGALRFGQPVE